MKLSSLPKKAQSTTMQLVLFVIAILVLLSWIGISKNPTAQAKDTFTSQAFRNNIELCYQKQTTSNNQLPDFDRDQLPDCCDPCPTVFNSENPAEMTDADQDGYPLHCLGNDGQPLPYATPGNLDADAYKERIESNSKLTKKIETAENDKKSNVHPVYELSCR